MKNRHMYKNLIVKEKISKITFFMRDVHCSCTPRKLKVQYEIMHFKEDNDLGTKCIAANKHTFVFLSLF